MFGIHKNIVSNILHMESFMLFQVIFSFCRLNFWKLNLDYI